MQSFSTSLVFYFASLRICESQVKTSTTWGRKQDPGCRVIVLHKQMLMFLLITPPTPPATAILPRLKAIIRLFWLCFWRGFFHKFSTKGESELLAVSCSIEGWISAADLQRTRNHSPEAVSKARHLWRSLAASWYRKFHQKTEKHLLLIKNFHLANFWRPAGNYLLPTTDTWPPRHRHNKSKKYKLLYYVHNQFSYAILITISGRGQHTWHAHRGGRRIVGK